MKVIFSRKGFDSAAGGYPSPIINGSPLSIPIPSTSPHAKTYKELGGQYADLVSDLTQGKITANSKCHLDPDINRETIARLPGWRGALGQVGAAQGHLANQGIKKGDLFIFWGLFRSVEKEDRWKYVGQPEHRIWGWLQVDEIVNLGADGTHVLKTHPWLRDHPHVTPGWVGKNVLYIGSEELKLENSKSVQRGFGVLKAGLRLTADKQNKSLWKIPDWFNPHKGGSGMTYNPNHRWNEDGTIRSAARGQEFVAVPRSEAAQAWIEELLSEGHA